MRRKLKIVLRIACFLLILLISFIAFCNYWVISRTKRFVYATPLEMPSAEVALVLGTSKFLRNGNANPFFKHRMDAAAQLYFKKKVKHFILSGDNSLSYYNEPQDMKLAMMARGVPDTAVTLDYAGFRTFDSVVRSKKIFNQNRIIIVTQEFHIYRALFISQYYNIEAYGYAAEKVSNKNTFRIKLREWLARCNAVVDLYILNQAPKFLGDKIPIKI